MQDKEELKELEGNDVDYIETIQELKRTTVSKESYEKLKNENKKLLDSIVNGATVPTEQVEDVKKPSIEELREELYGEDSNLNNLEYVEKTLQLRDALMERGDPDPFVPFGKNITPEQSDRDTAERVAKVLKECVEYADGDSIIFTNELQRRTNDINIPNLSAKKSKRK